MVRTRLFLFWLVYCLTLPQQAHAAWQSFEESIMGTSIKVEAWHAEPARVRAASKAIFDEMRRLNAMLSPQLPDSELTQLNNTAYKEEVMVNTELANLISKALHFSELSNGAFDITFASVGNLYDYRKGIMPDQASINSKLPAVNYHRIKQDGLRVRFTHPDVKIDLGGIAKGYAVDRAIEILKFYEIEHALVSAGGDSRIIGSHDGRPWMIGIRDPDREMKSTAVLPLMDTAISTSGDYERFFKVDGVRHHHIITPSTGDSPREVRSVTVIGPKGITTDAMSTTVFVLGVEKGMALVNSMFGIEAVIIDKDGKLHYSNGLAQPKA